MTTTELLIVFLASCMGMFVKSVVGMGYPLFAVPLISLAIGVEPAVVIITAPNLIANGSLCFQARSGLPFARDLPALVLSAMVGVLIGTYLLVSLPEEPLLLVLVAIIAVFVIQYLWVPELTISSATSRRWSPLAGGIAGLMQGAVGVAGPAIAVWLHGYRLRRDAYVFSVTGLFLLAGLAQVTYLIADGRYDEDRLIGSAVALIAVVTMLPLGIRLRSRLSGPSFERSVLGVLVLADFALMVRVVS